MGEAEFRESKSTTMKTQQDMEETERKVDSIHPVTNLIHEESTRHASTLKKTLDRFDNQKPLHFGSDTDIPISSPCEPSSKVDILKKKLALLSQNSRPDAFNDLKPAPTSDSLNAQVIPLTLGTQNGVLNANANLKGITDTITGFPSFDK
ncbi:hypothetical protein BC829DRAFT_385262 [Chytridium lagenaria]|nr:hypothetical protein BC829DRAFT_385262 [Chytridium lagenaria]